MHPRFYKSLSDEELASLKNAAKEMVELLSSPGWSKLSGSLQKEEDSSSRKLVHVDPNNLCEIISLQESVKICRRILTEAESWKNEFDVIVKEINYRQQSMKNKLFDFGKELKKRYVG